MSCSVCHKQILTGSPIMGHLKNGEMVHMHHQACFIAKIAQKCICPTCKEPLNLTPYLDSLPSSKKDQIVTQIEEQQIAQHVQNDPWVIVSSAVAGAVAGMFFGLIGGALYTCHPLAFWGFSVVYLILHPNIIAAYSRFRGFED